jgi:anthranilate phosphoribosyltransferase
MRSQTLDRVIMFQGLEGYDDIRPGTTVVAEYDGEFTDYELETAEYGMAFEREDLEVTDVATESARLTEEILTGERQDHFADAVALNAAVRIYARGDAEDVESALGLARSAIAEGGAQDRLAALRAF